MTKERSFMVWRIRKDVSDKKYPYILERGLCRKEPVPNPFGIGFLMPGFILYEMSRFSSEKRAKEYAVKHKKSDDTLSWELEEKGV